MRRRASPIRKTINLLLAFAFFFAMGPDAYGIHECPYHGHAESSTPGDSSAGSGTTNRSHSAHSAHDGPESDPTEGPCTWLVDCHASLESSLFIPASSVHVAVPTTRWIARPEHPVQGPQGPRHHLFELHLPNAPPLSI